MKTRILLAVVAILFAISATAFAAGPAIPSPTSQVAKTQPASSQVVQSAANPAADQVVAGLPTSVFQSYLAITAADCSSGFA
jgi:uncharacterized protein (UPF0333 family)